MPSRVWLCMTPWTIARHAPLSMGFPRQKSWSEVPFPPPGRCLYSGWLNKPTWFQWTAVKREHHGEAGEEIWVLRWWEVLGGSDGKGEDRSDRGTQGNDGEGLKMRCLESHWLAHQDEVKWKPNLGLKEEGSLQNFNVLKLECVYHQQSFQFWSILLEGGACQSRLQRSSNALLPLTQSFDLGFDEKIFILPSGHPAPVNALQDPS